MTAWRCGMLILLLVLVDLSAGCRAIGRFGESRQSIAARRLSRQGVKAMRQGDWMVAETLFSEALDVSDRNDSAHRGLSETLWQRGRRDEAIAHLERAVALSAGDPRNLQRLGRMYLEAGRVDDAAVQCQTALATDRDWAPLWALWGDCQFARGDLGDSLAAYHRALSIQPDYAYAQMKTAEIYHQQQRYDRLLATLDRVRENSFIGDELETAVPPGRPELLRGVALRALGRPDEAATMLARAAAKNPDDATPRLQLAALAIARGQVDEARLWLAQANTLDASKRSAQYDPAESRFDDSIPQMAAADEDATRR